MNTSIITKAGKISMLQDIRAKVLHVAVGAGNPDWDTDKEEVSAFNEDTNEIVLPFQEIGNVVVTPHDSDEPYVEDMDYTVDYFAGKVIRDPSGNIMGNQLVKVSYHVRPPSENYEALQLVAELGRRKATIKEFVVADEEGEIWTVNGRYSISVTPTTKLLVSVTFRPDELPNETIREVGVFSNPVLAVGLPSGQNFYEPSDIVDKGVLQVLNNIPTVTKTGATMQTVHAIISL